MCSGGNTGHVADSDKDCNGDCFGTAVVDDCNVCSGGNTGHVADSDKDECGECFGNGLLDCNGDCYELSSSQVVIYEYPNSRNGNHQGGSHYSATTDKDCVDSLLGYSDWSNTDTEPQGNFALWRVIIIMGINQNGKILILKIMMIHGLVHMLEEMMVN